MRTHRVAAEPPVTGYLHRAVRADHLDLVAVRRGRALDDLGRLGLLAVGGEAQQPTGQRLTGQLLVRATHEQHRVVQLVDAEVVQPGAYLVGVGDAHVQAGPGALAGRRRDHDVGLGDAEVGLGDTPAAGGDGHRGIAGRPVRPVQHHVVTGPRKAGQPDGHLVRGQRHLAGGIIGHHVVGVALAVGVAGTDQAYLHHRLVGRLIGSAGQRDLDESRIPADRAAVANGGADVQRRARNGGRRAGRTCQQGQRSHQRDQQKCCREPVRPLSDHWGHYTSIRPRANTEVTVAGIA